MKEFIPRKRDSFEIDKLAKQGHLAPQDSPGEDTWDESQNAEGKHVRTGSTITESAGNYYEHVGPEDKVRHEQKEEGIEAGQGTNVVDIKALNKDTSIYVRDDEDPADKFLREHDPNHPDYKKAA